MFFVQKIGPNTKGHHPSQYVLSILTQGTCPLEPTFFVMFFYMSLAERQIHPFVGYAAPFFETRFVHDSMYPNNFPASSNFCFVFTNICCLFIFAERQIHPFVGYVAQFFETGFVHVQK